MPFTFSLLQLVIFFKFLIPVNCSTTTTSFYALHHYVCPLTFFFISSYHIILTPCIPLNSTSCFCPSPAPPTAPVAPPLPAAQPRKVKLNSSERRRIQQEQAHAAIQSSTPAAVGSPAGATPTAAVGSPVGATPNAAVGSPAGATPTAAADPSAAAGPAARTGQQSRSQRRAQKRKKKQLVEKADAAAAVHTPTASDSSATPAGSQSQATQAPQAVPQSVQTSNAQAAAPAQLVGVPLTRTRVPVVMPDADATTASAVATASHTIHTGAHAWLQTAALDKYALLIACVIAAV